MEPHNRRAESIFDNMKTDRIVLAVIPLIMCIGCASGQRHTEATFTPLDASVVSPTSDRDQNRTYFANLPNATATPEDLKLDKEIQQMLTNEKKLAPPPSNVMVTTLNGVVTLRGSVPSVGDKKRICDRVAQMPGVARIDDQLQVHWFQ